MMFALISLLLTLRGLARSRAALHLEVLALRHQLQVLERSRPRRLRLVKADRSLWTWLSRSWTGWRISGPRNPSKVAWVMGWVGCLAWGLVMSAYPCGRGPSLAQAFKQEGWCVRPYDLDWRRTRCRYRQTPPSSWRSWC